MADGAGHDNTREAERRTLDTDDALAADRVMLGGDCGQSPVSRANADAEFLRWVATWLDRIDPILQAVYSKSPALTETERERLIAWLDGSDVQERLRTIAAALDTDGSAVSEKEVPND